MGVSESSHRADVKTVIGFQIWLRLYIEKGQNRCCNVKAAGGALYSSIQNCLDRILIFYRLSYNLFFLKKGHSHILMGDQDKIQNTALKHNGLKITIYIYIDNIYSWKSVDVHTVFHFSTDWSKTNAEHLISIHCLHLQIKILYFIQWTQNRSLEYACCVVLFLHSAPSVLCFYIRRRYRFIQR